MQASIVPPPIESQIRNSRFCQVNVTSVLFFVSLFCIFFLLETILVRFCFISHFYTQKLLTDTIYEKQMFYFFFLKDRYSFHNLLQSLNIFGGYQPFHIFIFSSSYSWLFSFKAMVKLMVTFVYICVYVASL